jgi:hypothetical protein
LRVAKFSPGFRLSPLDVLVLVAGAAGVVALASLEGWLGLVAGFPLAHFFLFCNVFRVARPLELLWAVAFASPAAATILWGVPGWWATSLGSVFVAGFVVAVEMRKPSYHGVGWRRINPGLPSWWETRRQAGQEFRSRQRAP